MSCNIETGKLSKRLCLLRSHSSIRSEEDQESLKYVLAALAKRFGGDEHGEDYEKVRSVAFTRFYGEDDEDGLVSLQRFAVGLVQSLMAEIVTCS